MKIWLSKNSEVPVREQIITQITLGITSGDLPVGEKLPSTQEIARRFQIHPNTVSNAYQKLAVEGWIEFRKGSGFFVCEILAAKESAGLDALIGEFLKKARSEGFSLEEIRSGLEICLFAKAPEYILVLDSDREFLEILVEEIRQATGFRVQGASSIDFQAEFEKVFAGEPNIIFAAMNDEKPRIHSVLPPEKTCIYMHSRSVSEAMTGQTRPRPEDLIAVVSGWDTFLLMAKTMLLAARIESDSLLIRSTSEENWRKGLKNAAMIICDSLAAQKIPALQNKRIFKLIADDSLKELIDLTR